jgi:hypothetical protein
LQKESPAQSGGEAELATNRCANAMRGPGRLHRSPDMNNTAIFDRRMALRLSAWLLLVGQILYVVVTLFHAGGDANNHPIIFAGYAASGTKRT